MLLDAMHEHIVDATVSLYQRYYDVPNFSLFVSNYLRENGFSCHDITFSAARR